MVDVIAALMYLLAMFATWIEDKDISCRLLGASLAVLWVYVMAIIKGVF